jgi:drug/metabolite transporter (DMT)-like permease
MVAMSAGDLLGGTDVGPAPLFGNALALLGALAVGPGLLGHTLVDWALGYLRSSVVAVSLLDEPVGATLLALVVLAEAPTPATIGGGAVVLVGIALAATDR